MPYGIIKVDTVTFTDNGVDKNISLSGLVQNPTFTGNVTATGTISGDVIRGGTTISGVTVTGTTANFVSGVFTTQVSGATIIATTGNFTSLTGTTTTGTTANFASGVFTTQVSGATVIAPTGTFTSLTGTTATFTSGIIASGTAALPSLAILSDPDTGIFSPGANQLAISTNGTQRATIDSSGRLLVGTSTSIRSSKLEVLSTGNDHQCLVGGNQIAQLEFARSSNAAGGAGLVADGNVIARIEALGNDGSAYRSAARIEVVVDGTPSASDMPGRIVFSTTLDGAASPTERMRITNAGLVGLGTSSPGALLDLAGNNTGLTSPLSATNRLRFTDTDTTQTNDQPTGTIEWYTSDTDSPGVHAYISTDMFNSGTGALVVGTGAGGSAAERLRIDSAGNVGIGTTSADALLTVNGVGAFGAGAVTTPSIAATGDLNTGFWFPAADTIAASTGGSERLRLTSTGLLGLGTSSPGNTLSVVGTGNATIGWSVGNEDGATSGGLYSTGSTSNSISLSADPDNAGANSTITFLVDATERARIDSSGRLLVGTSTARVFDSATGTLTPITQIESTGAESAFSITRNSATSTGPGLFLGKSRSGSLGGITVVQSDDKLGTIFFEGTDGTNLIEAATIFAEVDGTPGTNDMPGRLVFSTTADGASSPTERMRITNAGNVGIGTTSPATLLHISSATGSASPTATEIRIATSSNGGDWSTTAPWGRLGFYSADISGSGPKLHATIDTVASDLNGNSSNLSFKFTATGVDALTERFKIDVRGTATHTCQATHPSAIFANDSSEFARIDASGRLLVGTSTSASSWNSTALEIIGTTTNGGNLAIGRNDTTITTDNSIGAISFWGNDSNGTYEECARIAADADGTHNTGNKPTRLVFSTTLDGAATPTEALRITNDRVIAYNQPTPTSKSAAATLTIAELKTGIIQYTGAVATLTLPTGTLMEGGFASIYTNMAFEWSVINTGAGICTVAAGTDHTVIGSGAVAISGSARFVSRRTAANTFVSYRLS